MSEEKIASEEKMEDSEILLSRKVKKWLNRRGDGVRLIFADCFVLIYPAPTSEGDKWIRFYASKDPLEALIEAVDNTPTAFNHDEEAIIVKFDGNGEIELITKYLSAKRILN